MIDYLRIQNYKCWKDTGNIKLAPLTVFFGANSSGKSSIGQFLIMLKQSVQSSDRKSVFFTGNDNSAVDVGLPVGMMYNGELNQHLLFSYGWRTTKTDFLEISNAVAKEKNNIEKIVFSGDVLYQDIGQKFEVDSINYALSDDKDKQIEIGLVCKSIKGKKRTYELTSRGYDLKRMQGRAWDISSVVRFYGFPDEAVAYYQNADFLQQINLIHERLLSSVYYLGPLRNRAKRIYTWPGSVPDDAGIYGEDAISALLAGRMDNKKINLRTKGKYKQIDQIVAEELKKMGLVEDFKIERISESRQDYEVKVRTKGRRNYVDILDVGVGISQVLPVIVELFYAPPGSTIIIEQPELHLHPGAQAALADVMIDAIHAGEGYEKRNIQLIVESHSEHFLRRLQRRMAEGTILPNELKGYFVCSENEDSILDELQIDLYGDIRNWPKDFFGDISGDIYQQSKAAYEKRLKQ